MVFHTLFWPSRAELLHGSKAKETFLVYTFGRLNLKAHKQSRRCFPGLGSSVCEYKIDQRGMIANSRQITMNRPPATAVRRTSPPSTP
ncbi:hypothetical protein Deipe_3392 [Deinococcus peraridilitoris DSM 19664]|uniref:Uncharacterized protein n=1 Tax=Deinococcus peraridilitoris (strain DSM 19664 / LMG 22246 / CIP 109416 / KR-200) TaxID=937777 RepID=L0A5V8_DEIPD|nr:hypothetical protein Deipe_3392 [Deinococcus peraridilitoris DSM 19664]